MYFNILKKDLRRKRVINLIILVFVTISTMFAASSVNNIITVTNGLDNYFEKAKMADHCLITQGTDEDELTELLGGLDSVTDCRIESVCYSTRDKFFKDGERLSSYSNMYVLMPIDEAELNYFDRDNNVITSVEKGKAYVSAVLERGGDLSEGDSFTFEVGGEEYEFEYAGLAKDALLGSDFMCNPRFIISREDYDEIMKNEAAYEKRGNLIYIDTDDSDSFESELPDIGGLMFQGDRATMKKAYMISMLVAGMLLIVSVSLIIIALVVLRFTIGFTLEEEFREIGVMKAIGLKNGSIRNLYIVKYFGISVVGAVIGLFLSIPFGNMLISSVATTMNMQRGSLLPVSIVCSVAVVALIMLFCRSCTRRVNKLSPIDAVRSGQTGERFRKKSLMHLGKSKLPTAPFIALNDVLSSPKQYAIITAVFTLLLLLIMVLASFANTLSSDKLMFLFGSQTKDVYITSSTDEVLEAYGTKESAEDVFDRICSGYEQKLAENGMPAEITVEALYTLPLKKGDKHMQVSFIKNHRTKASDYSGYTEGTPPRYDNEIALSQIIADELGVGIGDSVTVTVNGEDREFVVTALLQSFVQTGKSGRFCELTDISKTQLSGLMGLVVDFDDDPSAEEVDRRIEKMKDILGTDEIMNAETYVKEQTGAADIVAAVKNMVIIIAVLICLMITLLMERSFISREKSEIALMKAIGFSGRYISLCHTLRFTIAAVLSAVIASALAIPVTKLAGDPIMGIMGAVRGVEYKIVPLELFAVYPLIIIAAVAAGTLMTTVFIKGIKASDTADIE
ncbi:MAG: FtsX-like permease family protein [Ruminococcus sp.]|nr:FtsX-like permease family protein [Ruminococcus sp.]